MARGILNPSSKNHFASSTPTNFDPVSPPGKIALEEHFDFAGAEKSSYASFGGPEFQGQIKDLGSRRIAEMDRGGIEVCIVSLVGPGIQAIPNPNQAVEVARRANDHLAENIAKNPKHLQGFAAGLPCNIWRIDNRSSRTLQDRPKAKHTIGHYLRENFYITTSGNFRTQTLTEVMLEVGPDRILYSVDYLSRTCKWQQTGSTMLLSAMRTA